MVLCGLNRRVRAASRGANLCSAMAFDLRNHLWGGVDSNHRPADYEFDPTPVGDQRKSAERGPDQDFRCSASPDVSRPFAVRRGTHAGHITRLTSEPKGDWPAIDSNNLIQRGSSS